MSLAKGLSIFVVFKKKQPLDSLIFFFIIIFYSLFQGPPTPGPQTCTGPWPVWNQDAQQEVSSGWVCKVSHLFTAAAPHCSHHCLSSPSCQISGSVRFSQVHEPYCELTARAFYENLFPDDLKWSWGGDAGARERLQIQVIVSREV